MFLQALLVIGVPQGQLRACHLQVLVACEQVGSAPPAWVGVQMGAGPDLGGTWSPFWYFLRHVVLG